MKARRKQVAHLSAAWVAPMRPRRGGGERRRSEMKNYEMKKLVKWCIACAHNDNPAIEPMVGDQVTKKQDPAVPPLGLTGRNAERVTSPLQKSASRSTAAS